jgi:hypothetical protein
MRMTIYRVRIKSFPVFERSYKNNPWGYRNGTGAKFNLWSRRYAWDFEKVNLHNF